MNTTTLFVCSTCRYSTEEKTKDDKTGGELFAEQVESIAADRPELTIKRHACLMACKKHCSAAITSEGKMTYVLGEFEPNETDANALIEYAVKHHHSESGVVQFKEWPEGVKGHFISRVPPLQSNTNTQ
ncbi:MAG: DUF1636 domain-containing protein [Pseudomonadota bacterium]